MKVSWALKYIEKMTEDKKEIQDDAGEENVANTCLKTTCHDANASLGFLSSLRGQRSQCRCLQMVRQRHCSPAAQWRALWVPSVLVSTPFPPSLSALEKQ